MKINRFEKLYCMNMQIKDIDLFAFKIYRFIIRKINVFISKVYIKYILNKNRHYENSIKKGEKDG